MVKMFFNSVRECWLVLSRSFHREENSTSSCLPALCPCSSARELALTESNRARVREETGLHGTKSIQYKRLLFNFVFCQFSSQNNPAMQPKKVKINFVAQIRDVLLFNIQQIKLHKTFSSIVRLLTASKNELIHDPLMLSCR